MIDFNHGSGRPVDDYRAEPVGDRVNRAIDAGLAHENNKQPPRAYVGASLIGQSCVRATQLEYMRNCGLEGAPQPKPFEGKTLRVFATGHKIEAMIGEWLIGAGFKIDFLDPDYPPVQEKQIGWMAVGGRMRGHVDGLIHSGPLPMAYPAVWECKGLNERNWQAVRKNGVIAAKPVYAAQVSMNQAYLNLKDPERYPLNPTLFTCFNKNTQEIYHELMPFDRSLAQSMSDRCVQILKATDARQLLPGIAVRPDHYECRMCKWQSFCWSAKIGHGD